MPLTDTAPEVERRMYEVYRRMTPARKVKLVADAYRTAHRLHAAGHRLRHPGASDAAVNRAWAIANLGEGPWIDRMRFDDMLPPEEHVTSIKYAIGVLDDLNIRYAIGGSLGRC